MTGLLDASRLPHTSPNASDATSAAALLALRRRHPHWGGKKLVAILARRDPTWAAIAPSTAAALLTRHGLAVPPPAAVGPSSIPGDRPH